MAVDIEPTELNFRRPFTVEIAQNLTIKNPNATPVAFKVKTTAPKQYCVRPNSGRIEPGESVEVAILLQAMKVEPPPDTKCRDKFLVQSAPITGDKEFASIQGVLESTDKSMLQDKKIRVNWLPADSTQAAMAGTPMKPQSNGGENEATPDVSRMYASPGENINQPRPSPEEEEKIAPKDEPETKSAVIAATETVKQTAQKTYEELQAELEKANIKITQLMQESQLRMRKAAGDGNKPTTEQVGAVIQQHAPAGVSVQMTAILCLVCFLFAYLFF